MKSAIYYISGLFALYCLLFSGCTKNELIIIDNREDTTSTSAGSVKHTLHFYPLVEGNGNGSENIPPASDMTPFPKGNRVQVYIISNGIQYLSSPIYQALEAGSLSPVSQPATVVNGSYDFYFSSVNTPANPPSFYYGKTKSVSNGVDYLWYGVDDQIMKNNTTVPVYFQHRSAQVVISVNNLETPGVVEWINFAMVQEPDTAGVAWDIYNGDLMQTSGTNVYPSQSLMTSKINMPASGLMCSQFLIPVQYDGSLDAYLSLKMRTGEINGYSFQLPIQNGQLQGGNSYHYTVNFGMDTVYIGDVNIKSWIEVDLDGNPLYPEVTTD